MKINSPPPKTMTYLTGAAALISAGFFGAEMAAKSYVAIPYGLATAGFTALTYDDIKNLTSKTKVTVSTKTLVRIIEK